MEKITYTCPTGEVLCGYKWLIEKPKANIILVTGMKEYLTRYEKFIKILNENGFNVYGLDCFGQGTSAKDLSGLGKEPKEALYKYAEAIYELKKLIIKDNALPIYYFSHSMGSFIMQELIQRHQDVTDKLILCGSSGPRLTPKLGYFVVKLLTNDKNRNRRSQLSTTDGFAKTLKHHSLGCEWISYNKENYIKYSKDPYCNYKRSAGAELNVLTCIKNLHKIKRMKKINKSMQIFIISGADDPVSLNGKTVKKLLKLYKKVGMQHVELKIYPNMRHELLNENDNQQVISDILNFYNN